MLLAERTRTRPRLDREVAPAGALVAGALAVAFVAAITGLQVTIAALDESVYKLAAVQHANAFPFGPLEEHTSRGIARLYSYVVSPLFFAFTGDVAIRLARALNGVFFAGTAIPVFLLARRVTRSDWSAAAAGVLAVAVPWLTVATIMFSESLAYLLFACAVLAMLRAFEAPGWRRDLLVIGLLAALVLTRVQFVVLALAWVGLIVVWERRNWRRFPVTSACVALVVAAALVLVVVGVLSGRLRDLAGPYYDIANRDAVPGNFGLGLLWEIEMLAIGVGLLPAILAAAWFRDALARRADADGDGEPAFRFAALVVTVVAVLFAGTLWAQGGFLDFRSEERYFIYAVPLLWVGAVAAVERRELRASTLVVGGIALAFILFTIPISVQNTGEQAFLGPVSMSAGHVLPRIERSINDGLGLAGALSSRDIAGLVCLLIVGFAAWMWRRGPRARWLALVPAVALQLFVGSYAFAGVYGKLKDIGGLTPEIAFSDLGWVDRATPGDPEMVLVDNHSEGREGAQRNTVFWNDEVTELYRLGPMNLAVPGFPVFTLPTRFTDFAPDLRLGAPLPEYAITAVDSPLWQVAGETVKASPDGGTALIRPSRPWRATWIATGLETDGHVVRDVELHAAGGQRVTMDLRAPDEGDAVVRVDLGGSDVKRVEFGGDPELVRQVRFDLCDETAAATGLIGLERASDIGGRFSGARVMKVHLEPCR
ncbi:MAG TPA: hypothetical protein VF587_09565 [Solirubrobacteraceae bacterium]|jgi:hypothetical protein